MTRCINIDWLEVYALEIAPRPPEWFTNKGYEVRVRAYGSPQYKQMFTIYEDGFPMIEIRRDPYSLRSQGGIFLANACHIRLSNRACYLIKPVRYLYQFMVANGFRYQSISRIDIALDFNEFDNGEDPADFIAQYMRNEISKINQCNVHAHGSDLWAGRVWNSIKWGAPTSCVTTKIYNKSLELAQVKDKFYIRDAWQQAGLDCTRNVWRIEFSINSQGQTLKDRKEGGYIKKSIADYETREQQLFQFDVLMQKYFHFKKIVRMSNGKLQRKDRCPDLPTIAIQFPDSEAYKPVRNPTKQHEPTRTIKMLVKKLLETGNDITLDYTIRKNAIAMAKFYTYEGRMTERGIEENERRLLREQEEQNNILELSPEKASERDIINNNLEITRRKEMALLRTLLQKYSSLGTDPQGNYLPF